MSLSRPSRPVSLVVALDAGPPNRFPPSRLLSPPTIIHSIVVSKSPASKLKHQSAAPHRRRSHINKSLPPCVCGGSGQGRRLARFEMGRKPTPLPLMLAEPSSALDHTADGEPTLTETTAQGASPVASRSPVSLRSSPFSSRFAPKRPQPGRSALPPANDVDQRSQSPRDGSAAPTYHHPTSSALDSPPVSSPQHAGRRHESKKPVKSGFFHFNKSSKGSNQFLIPANQQQHQDSREHLTSSGSDGVTVPRRRGTSKSSQKPFPLGQSPTAHGTC